MNDKEETLKFIAGLQTRYGDHMSENRMQQEQNYSVVKRDDLKQDNLFNKIANNIKTMTKLKLDTTNQFEDETNAIDNWFQDKNVIKGLTPKSFRKKFQDKDNDEENN